MGGEQNIWQDGKGRLPEEKLVAYLQGRLSPDEQHEVEQWLSEEGLEQDALEGLLDTELQDAQAAVQRINHRLRKDLAAKPRRRTQQIVSNPWSWLAILIVLLLAVLAYAVIYMAAKK